MNLKDTKTTNTLLLIIVIPLVFYILKILSFIFIPLIASMFIALIFLPLMRWFNKRHVPKFISIFVILIIFGLIFKISGELIKLSSKELMAVDTAFLDSAKLKLTNLIVAVHQFFGIEYMADGKSVFSNFIQGEDISKNFGTTLDFIRKTLTMTLMTAFFVVLWLAESINFEKLLNNTILKQKYASVKTFMKIEKDLIKFIKVKILVSLFTGIGIGLACVFFDVKFPIFWGLFAFLINFVQMIGSFISVILLAIFAFIQLDPTSTLFFFVLSITGVQVLFGGVLEPVFMGKSFSINIITILVMLMLWGYIWGIPGLIMAIPLTVFIKIILEQNPKTKLFAGFLSGKQQ
ncbi:Predicted PurR-regulated permease PerM [Lutibacter agarilyticus]|uniref:Predicted PurR-regulated permease PerM n=1 Tax=Lutibacter agarilyticus TaxID=1109740 RepID=A0A238YVU2_9FLAO|nr:AI-2E family transporter [Lutibacter agarilyticus]SNR75406.1 Predicted PurR-regulated permease PerM [Lutibacter agarilyticus]